MVSTEQQTQPQLLQSLQKVGWGIINKRTTSPVTKKLQEAVKHYLLAWPQQNHVDGNAMLLMCLGLWHAAEYNCKSTSMAGHTTVPPCMTTSNWKIM